MLSPKPQEVSKTPLDIPFIPPMISKVVDPLSTCKRNYKYNNTTKQMAKFGFGKTKPFH
jgi:hypothetical protein